MRRHHGHQDFLCRLGAGDLPCDASLAHRHNAIRHRQNFRQLRRNDDDRDAGLRHVDEEIVDLHLGADVDAARRFVDNQDFWPERQPARQHDLLLIAARELARRLFRARHADRQELAELVDQYVLLALVDEPAAADLVLRGDGHVGANGEAEEQSLLLAILGNEADAVGHRIAWACEAHVFAIDADRPMIERIGPEDGAGGLRAAGADETGEAEDLAVMSLERNAHQFDGVRIARVAPTGQALDLERDLAMLGDWAFAIERADVAPDHHANDRFDIGFGDVAGADVTTVAQHGVAIAETENLVQPMRDEDDRQTFGLQRPHDAGEIGDPGFAQSGGRLVHDDEPRLHGERAGDLNELLLGDGKVAHLRHGIALEPDALGDGFRLLSHAPPAHEQLRARFAANEHVLGDRHVGGEGELLIDGDDSSALGVVRRRKSDRLPEQLDFARIGALRAGENLKQRRLAGPVLAQERVDLGRSHFEMDVLKRTHAGKALADASHFEDGAVRLCRSGRKRRRRVGHSGALAHLSAKKGKARRERRAFPLCVDYFTSLRRSAVLRFSLVIATGVRRVICCAGFVPSLRKVVRMSTPVALCLPGNCSIVAVISPSRILPRVSGSASKPRIAMPLRLRALTASRAPSAMSSLAATITCGGVAMPASAASVTERPLARSKPAVCSKTILYLSFALSSTLCRPLLRSIAGLAPDWPCRLMMVAPFGNIFSTNSPCASPPLTLSAPTWPRMPVTDGTRRSTVTTGTLASTASCSAGAIASTSFGDSTMPLTPLASAASMSAVCFGEDTWPSLSSGS